jgi:hypothetical protein
VNDRAEKKFYASSSTTAPEGGAELIEENVRRITITASSVGRSPSHVS